MSKFTLEKRKPLSMEKLADHIINDFSPKERFWVSDSIIEVLQKYFDIDELTAIETEEEVREEVKDRINVHAVDSEIRGIPPRVRLHGNELLGKQRPQVMDELEKEIKKLDPFEFQRVCCVFIKEIMNCEIIRVRRLDGGADIIARRDFSIVAQARLHGSGLVGKNELEIWALQAKENYSGAAFVFITTVSYTLPAKICAEEKFIKLIDGEQIAYFLSKQNATSATVREWLENKCKGCIVQKCDLKPSKLS